jgi:hypothetical protein
MEALAGGAALVISNPMVRWPRGIIENIHIVVFRNHVDLERRIQYIIFRMMMHDYQMPRLDIYLPCHNIGNGIDGKTSYWEIGITEITMEYPNFNIYPKFLQKVNKGKTSCISPGNAQKYSAGEFF